MNAVVQYTEDGPSWMFKQITMTYKQQQTANDKYKQQQRKQQYNSNKFYLHDMQWSNTAVRLLIHGNRDTWTATSRFVTLGWAV